MKKAAVPTTTARGAAVSSSKMTAVQSVYMALRLFLGGSTIIGAGLILSLGPVPALAGIVFDNCVTGSDGSVSCDTRPTGNTLTNDIDARFGLMDEASPGWNEFMPDQGFDDDFGGNWT